MSKKKTVDENKTDGSKSKPADGAIESVDAKVISKPGEEIDGEWFERLSEFRNRKAKVAGDMLQFYYDVGLFAIEMENEKAKDTEYRKYGAHSMEEAQSYIGLGKSSVYAAIQFATKIDEKELQRMKDAMIPWRAAQKLLVHSDEDRDRVLTSIEKGEITTSDDVPNGGELDGDGDGDGDPDGDAPPKPTGMQLAITKVKSFNSVAKQAEAKGLPGLIESVHEYQNAPVKTSKASRAEFASLIAEANDHLITMERLLDSAKLAIKEILSEVEE